MVPGPACYGRGGTRPTVTDADLVLGRASLGRRRIPRASAPWIWTPPARRLDAAGVDAAGVVAVVDAEMEQALRTVSIERGVSTDRAWRSSPSVVQARPRLRPGRGDGGIPVVIVPAAAGVLSAVVSLTSPQRRDVVRVMAAPAAHRWARRRAG